MKRQQVAVATQTRGAKVSSKSMVQDENMHAIAGKASAGGLQAKKLVQPTAKRTAALTDITNKKKATLAVPTKQAIVKPVAAPAQAAGRPRVFGQPTASAPSRSNILPAMKQGSSFSSQMLQPYEDVPQQASFADEMDVDIYDDTEDFVEVDEIEAERSWEDIDAGDWNDPQSVAEYVDEIYDYCRIREAKHQIPHDYMARQVDINEKMRSILIDWMLEVHLKFKLLPETMFLAVNIIDRFLATKCVARDQLQLVGVTSMFIASKYEEIYPPECNDFVYISANAYSKEQILAMEQCILNTLGFNLTCPTSLHFLRRFSKAARSDYRIHTLSKFLIELSLVDLKMSTYYLPSMVAASSVFLARVMTHSAPVWNSTLEHYTKYEQENLRQCVIDLNNTLRRTHESSLQAVIRKYSNRKFGEVAKIDFVEIN